jgi:alpha-L-glutamate ligase-like protein
MRWWNVVELQRTAKALHANGVLGMNRRNSDYMLLYNPRSNYPLVDDKLLTKQLAAKHGVNTPDLYGLIEFSAEAKNVGKIIADREEFVVKPARGSGGDGIVVVKGRVGNHLRLANRSVITLDDLEYHTQSTLAGIYSLGGQPDKALIEYCVQFDLVFENISFQGVPDIRLIAYRGVPVMGMVRLPTSQSGGKANLHQGAIGAGINLATGRTLTAVHKTNIVSMHPDTLAPVTGVQIPHFDAMLEIAARCNEMTGLGYIGVDAGAQRQTGTGHSDRQPGGHRLTPRSGRSRGCRTVRSPWPHRICKGQFRERSPMRAGPSLPDTNRRISKRQHARASYHKCNAPASSAAD